MGKNNLLEKMKEMKDGLPKRQRLLCEYICENVFEVSTLTINELAKQANVGTTTVIRTMQALGYDSYIQFKNELQEIAVGQVKTSYNAFLATYWDSMRYQNADQVLEKVSSIPAMATVCEALINRMKDPQFVQSIKQGVGLILSAQKVYTLGLRGSYPLALYMDTQLVQHGINVFPLSDRPDFLYDRLAEMTEQDLLIAIGLSPVTELTVKAIDICHKRNIPIVLITSSSENSSFEKASAAINIGFENIFVTSVPPVAVIELLCQEIGYRTIEVTTTRLQRIEKLMQQYDVSVWEK